MILADSETYWTVLTNPAHIGAELTWSVILDVALLPFIRMGVRWHDRRHHGSPDRILFPFVKLGIRRHDAKKHPQTTNNER